MLGPPQSALRAEVAYTLWCDPFAATDLLVFASNKARWTLDSLVGKIVSSSQLLPEGCGLHWRLRVGCWGRFGSNENKKKETNIIYTGYRIREHSGSQWLQGGGTCSRAWEDLGARGSRVPLGECLGIQWGILGSPGACLRVSGASLAALR